MLRSVILSERRDSGRLGLEVRVQRVFEGVHDGNELTSREATTLFHQVGLEPFQPVVECGCGAKKQQQVSVSGPTPSIMAPGLNTVFVDRKIHEAALAGGLVDVGEEIVLLIAVMRFHAVVPGDSILGEIELVCWRHAWRLLVDAVEASDE